MSIANTLIERIRKLPAGNIMIRIHIEHTEDTTIANVFTEDKTLRIEIDPLNQIQIEESKAPPFLPSGIAA